MDIYERANMIVASVPCPPLAMLGNVGEDCKDTVFISHDLLRTTFIHALTCMTTEEKQKHMQKCEQAAKKLYSDIDEATDDVYTSFCTYMRSLLQAHFAIGNDIRFKDIDYVCLKDKIHKCACSHLRGLDHIYQASSLEYDEIPYKDLVQIYATRLRFNIVK